ncbi:MULTISPECIES: GNAT family N-acetyltransferase [unclassified Streptomyces]|uniref:GNAT family N-acetyltransferase n=1 Tax=unclassified Streptomyces TaxID=2593676 RepID=UPI000B883F4B|nr:MULTISPECIES: GNAT family N-acetyltransferase [unclassified Streptomyces]MYZ34263.1 GNAT family N-acetyltransferase [Streptomyces sp. SID4917]
MTVIVRDFRTEDAGAVVRLRWACVPFQVTTEEALLFDVAHANPAKKYRLLLAEEDGELIGSAHTGIAYDSDDPGQSSVTPQVHPERRGRGAGSLLLRTAEEHLAAEGATSVYAWALDEPSSRAFAERHGYRPTRPAHFQRLDLAGGTLPEPPPLPPGFELRTAADFADDPRPLFEADAETTSDEPSDISTDFDDYADWLNHTWNHPLLDRELTTVVMIDGRVAAFTAAQTDGRTRYASGMTGTLRAYRGQGLAKLAKTYSLHRARAAGYTGAYTANDAENGPMLAINRWLGYKICASEIRHVRALSRRTGEDLSCQTG